MTRIKVSQELDMDIDAIEDIFKRPVIIEPVSNRVYGMLILKHLTRTHRDVINLCKVALVREFGTAAASRYIRFRETTDERDIQFWLKYQIERTSYPDTYCLIVAAQKWFDRHPSGDTQG